MTTSATPPGPPEFYMSGNSAYIRQVATMLYELGLILETSGIYLGRDRPAWHPRLSEVDIVLGMPRAEPGGGMW